MIWQRQGRLWLPFGASRGALARALGGGSPPTINGSESLAAKTSGAITQSWSLASQTYTAGDFLLAVAVSYSVNISSCAGSSDDTYAEIQPGVGSFMRSYSGTVVSSLDASVDFTWGSGQRSVGGLITVSGASGGVDVSANGGGTDQTPITPDVTTTVDNCLVFGLIQARGSHVIATLQGALPSGWTWLFGAFSGGSSFPADTSNATLAIAYKVQAAAGAVGTGTWTSGLGASQPWLTHTIALAP